jgi:hypothetical protein
MSNDAATVGQPQQVHPTYGYGARENADDTRQAQQSFSNDTPTDVNFNAVVARSQQLTLDVLGKNYEANADRRNKLFDHVGGKSAGLT